MELKLVFSLAAWLSNRSRQVFSAWPNSRQTWCTFMRLLLACSLAGRSPCRSNLFQLWAAATLTFSISWLWILGCSTGWWIGRSCFVVWQQQRTVVTAWTSQWRGCRCWKIENIMGSKNKISSWCWEPHILSSLFLNSLLSIFMPLFNFQVSNLGISWHAPALCLTPCLWGSSWNNCCPE